MFIPDDPTDALKAPAVDAAAAIARAEKAEAELDAVGYRYAHEIEAMKDRAEKAEAEVARLRGVLTLCRYTFVGFRDDDTAVRVVDGMHLPGPRAFAASVAIARIDAALATEASPAGKFKIGDRVRKHSGSWWEGKVVGTYSTEDTPDGYNVQLDTVKRGPVQIYPAAALERAEDTP